MLALDGTPNKAKLGANAILGVSMAVARAAAQSARLPLYAYLGGVGATRLPVPMMNIVNGGKHADELGRLPGIHGDADRRAELRRGACATAPKPSTRWPSCSRARAMRLRSATRAALRPICGSNEEACELIVKAIETAGYKPGKDIAIALDPAASSFFANGAYDLAKSGGGRKTSDEMIALYQKWIDAFPIVSIEDGLDENDWAGFARQTAAQGGRIQIVGDDIFVTNPEFIARGVKEKAANAVLIKLNQIGTVTETVQAIALCRKAGWDYVVSHRSGETEDAFLADFTVAMGGGQIKTGSASRSERIAKYNRLLEIEAELGAAARIRLAIRVRRGAFFATPFQAPRGDSPACGRLTIKTRKRENAPGQAGPWMRAPPDVLEADPKPEENDPHQLSGTRPALRSNLPNFDLDRDRAAAPFRNFAPIRAPAGNCSRPASRRPECL